MARKEDTFALLADMQKASKWLTDDPSRKVKEACVRFHVPYGTFWMVHERNRLIAAKVTIHPAVTPALVQKYRKAGESWGTIMARFLPDVPFGATEGAVRSAYTNATNLHAEGTRVGHGGRWLGGVEFHEVLYRGTNLEGGDAKQEGTTDDKGAKLLSDTVAKVLAKREQERLAAAKVAQPKAVRKPRKKSVAAAA